jgi:hypothetical protein
MIIVVAFIGIIFTAVGEWVYTHAIGVSRPLFQRYLSNIYNVSQSVLCGNQCLVIKKVVIAIATVIVIDIVIVIVLSFSSVIVVAIAIAIVFVSITAFTIAVSIVLLYMVRVKIFALDRA